MKNFIFILASYLCIANVYSEGAKVNIEHLARHPVWLKLLHVDHFGSTSKVHSPDFFLRPDEQARYPEKELQALIEGLMEDSPAVNQHVRCRYPARVRWLEAMVGSVPFDYEKNCPRYHEWAKTKGIESLSVVLATGYLGNPASYYGHALLKFNSAQPGNDLNLLDKTLNYGAIGTSGDDPLTYIFRGIFGGYNAGFSSIDFYHHIGVYSELELRDMWEYRLDLPKPSVDFVVDHAWEVLGQEYTYYFFRENCAFRMVELLEILDGMVINPKNPFYTIPQVIVKNLYGINFQGRPLVSHVIYHPSRQSQFYGKFRTLDGEEKKIFFNLVNRGWEDNSLSGFSVDSKKKIIDVILDYYRFVSTSPGEGANNSESPTYRKALEMRYRLPPGIHREVSDLPSSPHLGRPPSWLQISRTSKSEALGNPIRLRFRPAYYDSLDSDSAHLKNSGLAMGEIEFIKTDVNTKLWRFDLISIESINSGVTGLPGDNGFAWRLKAGFEQFNFDCYPCLTPRFQGDVGYGIQINDFYISAYAGGGVQDKRDGFGVVFGRLSAEAIYKPNAVVSGRLRLEQRQSTGSGAIEKLRIDIETRFAMTQKSDFRVFHNRENGMNILGGGVGFYW